MLCILSTAEHENCANSSAVAAATTDIERLFYSSIASPYTQRTYRIYLQKYLKGNGMSNVSELLEKDHKEIEHQIINFIITSKEKGMKRGAISNYVTPVLAFAKINDIMVNITKINKYMPPPVKSKKTFGYDHSQIQRIIRHMRTNVCDL